MTMLRTFCQTAAAKVRATSATDTSFPTRVTTKTEPADDGVVDVSNDGGVTENALLLMPYGVGDDNDAFAMRVLGWTRVGHDPDTDAWVPFILGEFTCTMGGAGCAGAANTQVVATERFCDTIAKVTNMGDDNNISITSPQNDTPGHLRIDFEGFQKVEITFDTTTGDPTNANCLYRFI